MHCQAKLHVARCDDSVLNEKKKKKKKKRVVKMLKAKAIDFLQARRFLFLYLFQKYSLVDLSFFFFVM